MELRPPLHLGILAIKKGAFGSPSTKVANLFDPEMGIYGSNTITLGLSRPESKLKEFSTLPKAPKLEPHHQCHTLDTLFWRLIPLQGIQSASFFSVSHFFSAYIYFSFSICLDTFNSLYINLSLFSPLFLTPNQTFLSLPFTIFQHVLISFNISVLHIYQIHNL